jgi:hypothetical protein
MVHTARAIALSHGQLALVDEVDFERINAYRWIASLDKRVNSYYAVRCFNGKIIQMHREILGAGKGMHVDHKNHDTLDNRRCNIREATPAQNQWNQKNRVDSNGYRGVYFEGSRGWRARIAVNGKRIHLGTFPTAITAFEAYRLAQTQYHGEFAFTGLSAK